MSEETIAQSAAAAAIALGLPPLHHDLEPWIVELTGEIYAGYAALPTDEACRMLEGELAAELTLELSLPDSLIKRAYAQLPVLDGDRIHALASLAASVTVAMATVLPEAPETLP